MNIFYLILLSFCFTSGGTPTNLTNNPAGGFEPMWSPDGSFIAFSSNRSGNYEIYSSRFTVK